MMREFLLLSALGVRTILVVVVLLAGIRLAGKRHVGEMRVDDILMVLMAGNAVQNAMTEGDGHLMVAVVCAGTLILVGWIAALGFGWVPMFERGLSGTPVVLVHDGAIVRANLRREQLTREQLMVAVRKQGVANVEDVRLAVLEANGLISVVRNE
jgi:uncharacterized membrane protein YcaP (DUF421 family)